jgi:DNA-binding HxlR family transcriptional regulator
MVWGRVKFFGTKPPNAENRLTPQGESLMQRVVQLANWATLM